MEAMSEHEDIGGPDPDASMSMPGSENVGSPSESPHQGEGASSGQLFRAYEPLTDDDPVRVGDFWLDARLAATPAGVAYAAHEDRGDGVMLLLLREGAAEDPAARARFSGEINAMHIDTVVARGGNGQDEGRMGVRFRSEDDDPKLADLPPAAPWVALAFDGTLAAVAEARRVLHAVDLQTSPALGSPSGPDFRLHWIDRTDSGRTRLWPLSWPSHRDSAGWISILTSWLLMILIAALGLLLAILVFQNAPLVSPPAPIPSQGSEGSGSSSPQSGSTPQSGSPTSGEGAEPNRSDSQTPTMGDPDESESDGGGEPTPNRRL